MRLVFRVWRFLPTGKLKKRLLQAGQWQTWRHLQPRGVQEAPLRPLLFPRKRAGITVVDITHICIKPKQVRVELYDIVFFSRCT